MSVSYLTFLRERVYAGKEQLIFDHVDGPQNNTRLSVVLLASKREGDRDRFIIHFDVAGGEPGNEEHCLVPYGMQVFWRAQEDDILEHLQQQAGRPPQIEVVTCPIVQTVTIEGGRLRMPAMISGRDLRKLAFDVEVFFHGPVRVGGGSHYAWRFKCVFDLDEVPVFEGFSPKDVRVTLLKQAMAREERWVVHDRM